MNRECENLRAKFCELLVEPESASQELLARWESHRLQCPMCSSLFKQARQKQERGEELVGKLASLFPLPAQNDNFARKRKRKTILAAAALLLAAMFLIHGFLPTIFQEKKKTVEHLEREKIRLALKNALHGKKFSGDSEAVVEEIYRHVTSTRQKLDTIEHLAEICENDPCGRDIPFLALRLKLHCRLALKIPDTYSRLAAMEGNHYPDSAIGEMFAFPIDKIGNSPKRKRLVSDFFRQAAPHILEILHQRHALLRKIGPSNIREMGGEVNTLALIDHIEYITTSF